MQGSEERPGRAERSADPEGSTSDVHRRRFLRRAILAIGAGITAALGIPAFAFVTGPSRTGVDEETWIRLGSTASIEPGAPPTLIKATVLRRSGYLTEEQEISVFVTSETGTEFTVLSNICTHLACRVRWVEEQEGFFCPCHNAVFGPDGAVVQGPPPRPLDSFESMVEDGQLYFREA